MIETKLFIALVGAGSGVLGVVIKSAWDSARAHRDSERNMRTSFRDQLIDRITSLETRLDEHDRYCDDRIASAIQKSEAECDAKIQRELAELENRMRDRLGEVSEPMEASE